MALINMLQLVREGSGELFGAGSFFQQTTKNYHLPPRCGEGIDRGIIHDGEPNMIRRSRMNCGQDLYHLIEFAQPFRVVALLCFRG